MAFLASHQGQRPQPLDVGENADRTRGHPGDGAASRLASFPLPDSPDQPFPGAGRSSRPYEEYPAAASSSAAPQSGSSQDWAQSRTERVATEHGRGTMDVGSTEQEWVRRPQAGAAEDGLSGRDRQSAEQQQEEYAGGGGPWGPPAGVTPGALTIDDVEWHGRIEQDWYAATALVDLLSFIYVAIFYQVSLRCRHVWQLTNLLLLVVLLLRRRQHSGRACVSREQYETCM